eukprot:9480962-Pyramimonas_sp.AAC.2
MGSKSRPLCLLGAQVDQMEGCVEAWGSAAALGPVVWAAYQHPQGGGAWAGVSLERGCIPSCPLASGSQG